MHHKRVGKTIWLYVFWICFTYTILPHPYTYTRTDNCVYIPLFSATWFGGRCEIQNSGLIAQTITAIYARSYQPTNKQQPANNFNFKETHRFNYSKHANRYELNSQTYTPKNDDKLCMTARIFLFQALERFALNSSTENSYYVHRVQHLIEMIAYVVRKCL